MASPRFSKICTQRQSAPRSEGLLGPHVDDLAHARAIHARERQVVARGEADDAAGARLGLGHQQAVVELLVAGVGAQRREVVGEHEGGGVVGVLRAADAGVAGAEVAAGVEGGPLVGGGATLLAAQPGPLGAAGRDQHPLVGERVVAAMRSGRQAHRAQAPTATDGCACPVGAIAPSPGPARMQLAGSLAAGRPGPPRRGRRSVMTTSARSRRAMVLTPVMPHLVWSAVTTRRPAGLDEGLVGLRLEHVGRGEAGALVHAVHAEEDDVDVDRAQGVDRERSHQRVGRGAHAAAEDDGLVAAAAVVEHLRGRHGVGDHGQARDLRRAAG